MHDLVINGGTVIDGTGAPARPLNVAIDGGVITAVGEDVGSGREEIDAIDIGTQVPHGAVRAYVMGEAGANNEQASAADIEAMAEIVKDGLAAGALGFSTSRTMLHWARDRTRGERIPIEELVENQTRRTAQCYGLFDRGVIAPGMKADINVIDFDKLHIHAPKLVYDLPANGKHFLQDISGYHSTICSGQVIYRNGKATGNLPGKLIRGPQAAPNETASVGRRAQ
jgi:N-acyl-D-aspartate/D-glutamate deacylase